jgi:hypothetical protein
MEDERLVLWAGPSKPSQIAVPNAKELFLYCVFGSAWKGTDRHCPTLGDKLAENPALLVDKAGMDPTDIFMGSFSAGGSVLKRMLMKQLYRDKTSFLHLADATYTSEWVDKASRTPIAIEGFTRYAVDVINGGGDKLMVATASENPNGQYASGVENLHAMRDEIEARTGGQFELMDHFFDVSPLPALGAWKLGNVILADYCSQTQPCSPNIGHGGHVSTIGNQIWQKILIPWLDKGRGPVGEPGGMDPPPPPWGGGWAPPWKGWWLVGDEPGQPSRAASGLAKVGLGVAGAALGFFGARALYDMLRR